MSNRKNVKELKEIGNSVCELCKLLKQTDTLDAFQKTDFGKLDRKLFSDIIYFLLSSVDPDLVKGFTWPVGHLPKLHGGFVKDVFQAVNVIKERYLWSSTRLLQFQKSHFQDVRSENDKVVEFLKQLLNVSIFIVTKTKPCQNSREELIKEIQETAELKKKILENRQKAEMEKDEAERHYSNVVARFNKRKEQLIQLGIVEAASDNWDRNAILKSIEIYERKLLNPVKNELFNKQLSS